MLKAESANGAMAFTLEARVPVSATNDAGAIAEAFATQLNTRGYHASAHTTPVIETVSGNVYAFARDLVVNVETSGKTAAQIQAEIQQQLAAAGIPDTQVSVTDSSNQRKVTMEVQRTANGSAAPEPANITLNLTKDGKSAGTSDALDVQERKMRTDKGSSLELIIVDGAKRADFTIDGVDQMSDARLQAAVQAKLQAAGITVNVSVANGAVTVKH